MKLFIAAYVFLIALAAVGVFSAPLETPATAPACIASHRALEAIPTMCKDDVCETLIVAEVCDKAILAVKKEENR